MKKYIFIITLFLTLSYTANAQKGRERIKALKATYITNAIDLTSAEAEKFWPIYNEYSTKINTLKMNMNNGARKMKQFNNLDQLTDKEAENMLSNRMKQEKDILKLKINQIEALRKVISAKKIMKLQKAEGDFNRKLLQEYGKRRGMKRGN